MRSAARMVLAAGLGLAMTAVSWGVVAQPAEPTQAEPTQAEPTQAEPTQAEPTQAEPTQAEPTHAEPTRAEPTQAEPTRAEPTQAEPTHAEPGRDRDAARRQRGRRPPRRTDGWGEDPADTERWRGGEDYRRVQQRFKERNRKKPRVLPKHDQRVALGGAFVGVGLALLATGAGVYGDALNGDELCGLSGCIKTVLQPGRLAGESLMIGSSVMLAGALPVLLTGVLDDDRHIRESEGQLGAGASMTLLGLGTMAGGIASLTLEQRDRQGELNSSFDFFRSGDRARADPWGAVSLSLGGALTAIGVPLWLNGGRNYQAPLHQTPRLGQPMLPVHAVPSVAALPGGASFSWRLQ